ncbi:M1 family metallopeptidase [Rhodothermus marinus]|uniref:M1 family metallopeptidase n=1 Tax=Rhodothermus marinus TaxID=29549 RepID=UPI0012BA528B|nr:M1 family metallopeptidase [Rhodothermus marinus]BBM72085.1 aminopeptidase [Rhodothermus marinus]
MLTPDRKRPRRFRIALPGLICCLVLLAAQTACAQRQLGARVTNHSGGPLLPEQAAYDVTFYELALRVEPDARRIDGTLTVQARVVHPLIWFVLDLDTVLTVRRIEEQVAGRWVPRTFEHRPDGRIWTHLAHTRQPGRQVVLRVHYGGVPREAPYPPWIGGFTWARTVDGRPWIATSNQGEGADLWWPCKDHPSDEPDSMALHITVPEPLVVASNGRLRRVERHADGTRTYHWFVSTPINNYGVALNIAPYRTVDTTYVSVAGDTIPVTFWVLPERAADARRMLPEFLDHLAFYERRLGPYPFRADKYGIAHTPFLGMEHQTIIAYGSDFSDRPYGYDWLHHHELGHEWWGNLVTAYDWKDFWLHEGFCTYMQALYAEERFGPEAYRAELMRYRSAIRNRRPIAPRTSKTTTEMYFADPATGQTDNDIYYKGAWVLHTLRYLIGDAAFFRALRRMAYPDPALERVVDGRQCRFATTDDFATLVEEITGQELDWFFEVYVRRAELPRLVVTREPDRLILRWETPDNLPFPMPVEVQIGDTRRRIPMPDGEAVVPLGELEAEPIIDPDLRILRDEARR